MQVAEAMYELPLAAGEVLINQGGAQQVQADNLAAQLIALSHDPHKRQQMGAIGLNVVKKNQGAIAKTLAIIEEYTDV